MTIWVNATRPGRLVSRLLAGACLEDVNHEVYGGLYSQMVFGESFGEPPLGSPAAGFAAYGGDWRAAGGELTAGGGDGPRFHSTTVPPFADGEVGVEMFLPADGPGAAGVRNAGLVVRAGRPGVGADRFDGYEVALDAGRQVACLGRHQQDYRLLKDTPCAVPVGRWVTLAVKLAGGVIEVSVDGKPVARADDLRPLGAGTVGLRQWHRTAQYRNLWVKPAGGRRVDLPFDPPPAEPVAVSGQWGPLATGTAVLGAAVETDRPFVGRQAQRVTFVRGAGEVGIENRGLNRQGMAFAAGKPYEGHVWLRADASADVYASLDSRDGTRTYARTKLAVSGNEWRRYDFALTPDAADDGGRFSLRLAAPGSVVIGYAFLQPEPWGRYKGLPVRRDVADTLLAQGVTVLRYGGSMVNAPEYRWKSMVGPRDRRPPYRGHWYPHSTNGWGVIDFLDFCEAAGVVGVPAFNADERPEDLADFVEYVNGPADSPWGRRRAADGHPAPYRLRHLQLGNEEKVDAAYYRKFERLATAVWAKDPAVVPVVGDFQYEKAIADPHRVEGADSGVTSLAAHRDILALAKRAGREVWFDVHLWTDGPWPSPSVRAVGSYVDALEKLADGARHRVVVFELNGNSHDLRRGLANAATVVRLLGDGRVPVALAANCLQVDGHNDNGWDQGLVFLDPSRVWVQPPGHVTGMVARAYQMRSAETDVEGGGDTLVAASTRSGDGKGLCVLAVNLGDRPRSARLRLEGFSPTEPTADREEMTGPPGGRNTADVPARVAPTRSAWRHELTAGVADIVFPAHSFTTILFR